MEALHFYLERSAIRYHVQFLKNDKVESDTILVFLHEALGSIGQWKDFPSLLLKKLGHHGLIIERQGHGKSSPLENKRGIGYLHQEALEVLPQLLDQLAIRNPILIGHSDGASIGLLFASQYKTKALVAIAGHIFVEDCTIAGIKEAMEKRQALILGLYKYHGKKSEALVSAWADTWSAPAFRSWNIEAELGAISTPVLVIQSKDDKHGTLLQVEGILNGVKSENKKQFILEEAGHAPHLKGKELVIKEINNFVTNI